jgi:DNA-binding response OmpR family regulator
MLRFCLIARHNTWCLPLMQALPEWRVEIDRFEDLAALPPSTSLTRYNLFLWDGKTHLSDPLAPRTLARNLPEQTPHLALLDSPSAAQTIEWLQAGVDRCVHSAMNTEVLGATLRALTRRKQGLCCSSIQYGGLVFNHHTLLATLDGKELKLPWREAQVLGVFLQHVGQIIPKEKFLHVLNHDAWGLQDCVVGVYIHRLRKRLSSNFLPLQTIKGCGFFLKPYQDHPRDLLRMA